MDSVLKLNTLAPNTTKRSTLTLRGLICQRVTDISEI